MTRKWIFLFPVILIGCSGSQSKTNNLRLEIINQQINSWVNLMPGSKPTFFISGSLKIKNNEEIKIDSIKLVKCEVFQEGKMIYELHTDLRNSIDDKGPMNPGTERIFTLSLPTGAPINKELIFEKPVSISLFLFTLSKVKQYKIDSIYVIKAY
jgi:hypothetical protein